MWWTLFLQLCPNVGGSEPNVISVAGALRVQRAGDSASSLCFVYQIKVHQCVKRKQRMCVLAWLCIVAQLCPQIALHHLCGPHSFLQLLILSLYLSRPMWLTVKSHILFMYFSFTHWPPFPPLPGQTTLLHRSETSRLHVTRRAQQDCKGSFFFFNKYFPQRKL